MRADLADFANALREYIGLDPLYRDGRYTRLQKATHRTQANTARSRRRAAQKTNRVLPWGRGTRFENAAARRDQSSGRDT